MPTALFDEAETTLGLQRSCRSGPASVPQPSAHRSGHLPSAIHCVSPNVGPRQGLTAAKQDSMGSPIVLRHVGPDQGLAAG